MLLPGLVFVLFGIIHLLSLAYYKVSGRNKDLYLKLKISKILIVLLIIVGVVAGVLSAENILNESKTLVSYFEVFVVSISFPLGILGVAWFWGAGRELMSKQIKFK